MDENGDIFDQWMNEDVDRSDWVDPFSMGFEEPIPDFCQADCKKIEDRLELTTRELIQCQEAYRKLEDGIKQEREKSIVDKEEKEKKKPLLKSNKPESKDKKCSCENKTENAPVFREIYLQRFVAYLINRLDLHLAEDAHLNLEVKLTQSKIKTLHKFRNEKVEFYEVDQILTGMIHQVTTHQTTTKFHQIKEILADIREPLLDASMALAFAMAVVFIFRYFTLWKLVLVFVILSVGWHWLHMYKTELAVKKSKMMQSQSVPAECRKEEMNWLSSAFHYIKSSSSLTNPCDDYHKALLVDPIYDVNPLMAFADLASKIVLRPMRNFATEFAEAYKGLLRDLPWQFQVILLPLFTVVLLVVLILASRSTIRLPLGFEISPHSSSQASLAEELKDIRRALDDNTRIQTESRYLAQQHRSFIDVQDIQKYRIASGQILQPSGDQIDCSNSGVQPLQYGSSCANFTSIEGQNRLFARQFSEPVVFRGNTASADENQNGLDLKQRVCKKAKRRSGNIQTETKGENSLENNTTQEKSSGDNSSPLLENKIQTVEAIDNSKDGSAATENPGNDESKSEVDTSLDVTNDSVSCMDKELIEKGGVKDMIEETTASPIKLETKESVDCSTTKYVANDCDSLEDNITNLPGVEVLSPTSKRFLDKVKVLLEPETGPSNS